MIMSKGKHIAVETNHISSSWWGSDLGFDLKSPKLSDT